VPSDPAMALCRRSLPVFFSNYFLSSHIHLPFALSDSEDWFALLGDVAGELSDLRFRSLRPATINNRSADFPKSVTCITTF
jgi:hypothetical protein